LAPFPIANLRDNDLTSLNLQVIIQYERLLFLKEYDMRFFAIAVPVILLAGASCSIAPISQKQSMIQNQVTATISLAERHQTIEGFGAAIAWYDGWLITHPNKDKICDIIFTDLGLSILRLRNSYDNEPNFSSAAAQIYRLACLRMSSPPKILISSWSPPAALKSNASRNHGTLKKQDGSFIYDAYAQYWLDSVLAYEHLGIHPDYISIQNEPDLDTDYGSCIFKPAQSDEFPSYGRALAAVYEKLRSLPQPPKLLGPEVFGAGDLWIREYAAGLDISHLYGIAHHLYDGGSHEAPDQFITTMSRLAADFPDKPRFMTEFGRGNPLQTAWLIHNSLVYEEVSAYLYWDLIWNKSGLVTIEDPGKRGEWKNECGYAVNPNYYALKHYCKFIRPGWQRLTTSIDSNDLRVSAFISPDSRQLAAVVLNLSAKSASLKLSIPGCRLSDMALYQTAGEQHCSPAAWGHDSPVLLPPWSITTFCATVWSPRHAD
jgi:glucuronoarabinoxylan endo-1,4-beta-xylanase